MRFKYPKTYHLPWSPGLQNDDRLLKNLSSFEGQDIVALVKMDGENSTLSRDYYHARSVDSKHHPSREWIKGFHAKFSYNIPERWRICGENLFAQHSIAYQNLESYFQVFSIWDEDNNALSWDDTVSYCKILGLSPVAVMYRGPFNEEILRNLYTDEFKDDPCEGYVIRLAGSFSFEDFNTSVAKYVRKNHVQTDEHWMNKPVVPNGLKC